MRIRAKDCVDKRQRVGGGWLKSVMRRGSEYKDEGHRV